MTVDNIETCDVTVENNDQAADKTSGTLDEAIGGRDITYNNEIQRLLSYSMHRLFEFPSCLAKFGFYSTGNGTARCQFCPLVLNHVTSDLIIEPHDCDKSSNIAINADTTDYRYEANRILSFLKNNWPKLPQPAEHIFVGALDLARWGFYYTGNGDAARCTFCRLEIRGWECGDTAETEHKRWNSHCPFINNRDVGNVKLGEERSLHNQENADAHSTYLNGTGSGLTNSADLGNLVHTQVKHPKYSSLPARLGSYTLWSSSLPQRPEQLADAGFFYTSKGDRVICFQCGGGLKDWGRTDNPWLEHAKWFPWCSHVTFNGPQLDSQQQATLDGQSSSDDVTNREAAGKRSSKLILPANIDSHQALGAEVEELEDLLVPPTNVTLCKICLKKELGIVFMPCGHIAACYDCGYLLDNCPTCGARFTAFINVYFRESNDQV